MPPAAIRFRVGKGAPFAVLDMFDGTDRAVYDAALERLSSSASLPDLAARRAAEGALADADVTHFQRHWLGEWWSNQQVEPVLRRGIQHALERALPGDDHGLLPVEALWVHTEGDAFQVYVNEGPHQVTLIVLTPPAGPMDEPAGRRTAHEDQMWVAETGADGTPTIRSAADGDGGDTASES